ncbi:MAG: DUF6093 family protein [Aeromicrobium sp.]
MLADDISRVLPELRREAELTMLDTLAFGAMGTTTDPDGFEVDGFVADFTSPGKVAGGSIGNDQGIRTTMVGGSERPVITGGIHIPADSTAVVPTGTLVKVTTLGPDSPAHLLNRLYRIEGESTKSYQTARRFDVVEV